jgi:hypothetical protein
MRPCRVSDHDLSGEPLKPDNEARNEKHGHLVD